MATITELVAAVVVQSSAAAFSHFGVTLEAPQAQPPVEQRIVARTPANRLDKPAQVFKASACPDSARTRLVRA
jgi:hypothetical protein